MQFRKKKPGQFLEVEGDVAQGFLRMLLHKAKLCD